ncbi:ABC transporter transmembrane region [Bacteriovorax sp. BSW11_IV]|uniref:ABC transporter ATP-binding protein n=1 Tax=Bacteriovorax sp. BSW11_IV TaxID=1353529 RepID=UPI00038A0226|nr:ABC transporter ATP-binding protein [Bacteriovorax sp. BSW11_IV]EQC45772.1 ABC transporter transmembrane region [Bacteriovorax sp. BSW11_IV]
MIKLLRNQLFPYIIPHKSKVIGTILLSFVIAGAGALQIRLVKPIFDHGLSPNANWEEVVYLAGALLLIGLIHFPARFFHFYWIRYIVDRATCSIREDIFRKMQHLPTAYFAKSKQGNLISSIVNDTQVFSLGFKSIVDLVREPLKAAAFLGMAFYSDWQLTLVIFLIAPFLVLIFDISGKKVKKNQGIVQHEHSELTHAIAEGLSAHKLTKAFNLQNFITTRFVKAQDHFFNAQMKTSLVEELAHPLVELVGTLAFAATILFAHYRVSTGATTVGDFVSFVAALALFMDPIRKFSQANVKLSQAKAASDRIFEVLKLEEEKDEGVKEVTSFENAIEVKNLSFAYGESDVIRNLNLSIKKGEKVALVGLSGSGKSTLINLLLRLYDVDRGEILIDGTPIKDIKLRSLRDLFGLVSQDIFLFHDTIKHNLMLAKDFSDEQILRALKVSYADEFVDKLPGREQTVVGDRGARLSGGQQQRITIARAFLQNTDILLFDEATSALDNESEKVVQKALESIAGDKTVIAVAHRLSTIAHFDRIYVMREGEVVEEGNHEALMAKGGEYSKLYELSQK